MIAVPVDEPETIPDNDPIPATSMLLLLQTPPDESSTNVAEYPVQTAAGPVIAAGPERTDTGNKVLQPLVKV